MQLRVLACVCESVFLKGLESVFPKQHMAFCGGAVDEPTLFDMLPDSRPDVVIYELSGERDLPYVSLLHRNFPQLGIIVLFERENGHLLAGALERGAFECLPKTLTRENLFASLSAFGCGTPPRHEAVKETDLDLASLLRGLSSTQVPE